MFVVIFLINVGQCSTIIVKKSKLKEVHHFICKQSETELFSNEHTVAFYCFVAKNQKNSHKISDGYDLSC